MKKQNVLLSLTLLFCSAAPAFSQDNLKSLVCIVKPQYAAGIKEFYGEYGRTLAREGYVRAGALLRMRENGGFGSGVVVNYNGTNYVLTNFHVVEQAQSVSLEFKTDADESLQFGECKIMAGDRDYDLALIALPPDAALPQGFVLSAVSVKEGMEVWTAGFPGLGNKPSWQLGKGIISNETVKDSTLSNAKLQYVLQHTAQVDAGSSGGALLTVSPKEKSGYAVAGINTWKARGRENANFAIPSVAVAEFLKNAQTDVNAAEYEQQVEKRTKELLASRNDDSYKKMLPFISNSYIFSIPAATFTEMFADASKDANNDADKALRNVEPFEAFRIVIADAIYRRLKKTEPVYEGTKKDAEKIVAGISLKGKNMDMGWTRESDDWFLSGSSLLKEKSVVESHVRNWDDIDVTLHAGAGFSLDENEKTGYMLGWEKHDSRYFAWAYELMYGKKIKYKEPDGMGQTQPVASEAAYFGFSFGLHFQVPIKFCPVHTVPFVKIPLGINLGKEFDSYVGVKPGIRFAVSVGKKHKFLFLDAEYRYKYIIIQKDNPLLPKSTAMFGLSLGYAY